MVSIVAVEKYCAGFEKADNGGETVHKESHLP